MQTIIEKTPIKFGEWGKSIAVRIPTSISQKFGINPQTEYDMTLIKKENGKLIIEIEDQIDVDSKFLSDDEFLAGFDSIVDKYDTTLKALVDL
jgi:antitoxin component of MazEF toxin-antitoxin module